MKQRSWDLSAGWQIAGDPDNIGKSDGWASAVQPDAVLAHVPSIIQEFLPGCHGVVWYWCRFTPQMDAFDGGRMLLHFDGVDYKADVWLNGTYLGAEESGELPFSFDVTAHLQNGGENLLAVCVLNPTNKDVDGMNVMNTPHRNKYEKRSAGSSLNYGGICGGVRLEAVPALRIADVFAIADYETGRVTFKIDLDAAAPTAAKLTVRIAEKGSDLPAVAEYTEDVTAGVGGMQRELSFRIPDFKPWHVDSPHLYIAALTVAAASGTHTKSVRFGFRDFRVKDGFFYLNGKKLFVKSAHSGNAFPIGQMYPVVPGHMQKDFLYAKAAGFNMLRAIAGTFRPEQLALADEIGLLIYEECLASWCLGYSMWQEWADGEEYKKLETLYPDAPPGDEQAMLDRWAHNTEKMILRDRNHPSVVAWGLLNETYNNSVSRKARDFLPRLRELDPSRFVFLSSGRWDYDFTVGSASNPYSPVWENTWGIDGHPEVYEAHKAAGLNPSHVTSDNHFYALFPFRESDKQIYRGFGHRFLPVFISEFGHGAVFNVIDEIRHFDQYGARQDLEDYDWLKVQADAFTRDFARVKMDRTFAFPELVLRESQKNNALARREIFDVIRSNPRIAGYSLTGLLDHGWCGEGLWSYWRQWKPEMFDTVTEGWAPLRFCLFVSHNRYADQPLTVEAVLANDGVLKSGEYTARFAITENGAPVYTFTQRFTVDGDELAVPVVKRTDIHLPAGEYELCAEIAEGAPRANRLSFSVKDRAALCADGCAVSCLGLGEDAKVLLRTAGVAVTDHKPGDTPAVLLVGMAEETAVADAIAAAERGARVFFYDRRSLESETSLAHVQRVVPDAGLQEGFDWLYHKELVLNDRTVFSGIGCGLARGQDFTKEWPHWELKTDTTPDYPICPAFETGSYRAGTLSYYLVHAMAGYNFGSGRVYLSTFEVLDNIGSPTADRLLVNTVRHLCEK